MTNQEKLEQARRDLAKAIRLVDQCLEDNPDFEGFALIDALDAILDARDIVDDMVDKAAA